MGYTVVKSFERGIDTRRLIDTTEPGALLDAVNCHITRGGEIEKRAAFVQIGTFPTGTVGMYATVLGAIHTWGSAASPSGPLPADTTYHSIPDPDGSPLVKILSVEEFNTKLYVIALYADGTILHWYDDVILYTPTILPPPDPGGGGGTVTPPTGGLAPGMPRCVFYLENWIGVDPADYPSDVGYQGVWIHPPSTPDLTTYVPIIETDGVNSYGLPIVMAPEMISWDASHASTAALLMEKINDFQVSSNVMCSVIGNKVTVWVNEVTTEFNGWIIELYPVSTAGSPVVWGTMSPGTYELTLTFSGGLSPAPATMRRDVSVLDAPPPVALNNGTFVLAHNHKLYCVQRSRLNFSANDNATRWDSDAFGAGFIDHTMIGEGTPVLLSLADFGGDLAVFGQRDIFIWHMDPDPRSNFKRQVLHRTGTIAPHSTCAFGESEVMYLDRSGIRSLRSRSGIDAAFASDIGNNIDTLVVDKLKTLTAEQLLDNVWADIEPRSGRLWMALYNKIYVLSYFPSSHVAAWTIYDAAAFPVDMLNSSGDNLYWRSGDKLMCYGGLTGDTYDTTEALARFTYIDGGKAATFKNWQGVDFAAIGAWQVKASFDPTIPTALDLIANIIKSTYAQQKIAMNGQSPAVSLELKSTSVGAARIGNAAIHYTDSAAD